MFGAHKAVLFTVDNYPIAGLQIHFLQGCELCSFNPVMVQIITAILKKLKYFLLSWDILIKDDLFAVDY